MRAFFATVWAALTVWAVTLFAISLVPGCAQAATFGVHAVSHHNSRTFDRVYLDGSSEKVAYNNTNPGLYVITRDGWTAGFYENSYYETTAYAGWTWSGPAWGPVRVEATFALATGYDRVFGCGVLRPMLLPSAVVSLPEDFKVRLSGMPIGNSGFLHLSIERSFQ